MPLTVKAHKGDAKTLLAFDLPKDETTRLAGFTIQCQPQGQAAYYLFNDLQFEIPGDHAQVATEPPYSSINAPFHKFRWLHVPGVAHQGLTPFLGPYTYTVTPRYFDDHRSMLPLDATLSRSVDVDVVPFVKGSLEVRFTRGYVQSQGYVRRFGPKAKIRPKGKDLVFDTSLQAGIDPKGNPFTYRDEYVWLGFTAREKVFELLNDVLADGTLHLDLFAYDLNEPDLVTSLFQLAQEGRIRVVLDNAGLHHASAGKPPKPEDEFENGFRQKATGEAAIIRGKFRRYAHDKIMIVSRAGTPRAVLTGSTNFSVTGFYVNSNHVVVSTDPAVMSHYADLFQTVWDGGVSKGAFLASDLSKNAVSVETPDTPKTEITFSPHTDADATKILNGIADRVAAEGTKDHGSVLFAVMEIDQGTSPVYTALNTLHASQEIFSYGVSDSPKGIYLYEPAKKDGVLVTGLPARTKLPKPFNQVPGLGRGHQIHHKFVVCGFNGDDPVVYCGSSNLALGGEEDNGDNLLAIHDGDVATAFAIEAVALVDHFQFLDRYSDSGPRSPQPPPALLQQTAQAKGAHLSTTDGWTKKFYDPNDLYCLDRELFIR
jgi:phosphatidylserine/phosphatidylglycerophosphate/cardiolipin synthase-like enzyme